MKTLRTLLFLTIISSTVAMKCDKDNLDSDLRTSLTLRTWRVSLFQERGNNQTSHFTGYTFTFQSNGTVIAQSGNTTRNGSWNLKDNQRELELDFGPKDATNRPLGELTDDWQIKISRFNFVSMGDNNSSSDETLELTQN